jgi:hypothetical protein
MHVWDAISFHWLQLLHLLPTPTSSHGSRQILQLRVLVFETGRQTCIRWCCRISYMCTYYESATSRCSQCSVPGCSLLSHFRVFVGFCESQLVSFLLGLWDPVVSVAWRECALTMHGECFWRFENLNISQLSNRWGTVFKHRMSHVCCKRNNI